MFNVKKIIALISIICITLTTTACNDNSVAIVDENGDAVTYAAEELGVTNIDGIEGIFVLNEDGTYSPIISNFVGYEGIPSEANKNRYMWFTENGGELKKLIPKITKGKSKLVMLYNTANKIPSDFILERYNYLGYTVGCHIYRDEDNSVYIETSDALPQTIAASSVEALDEESIYKVSEINGSSDLPINNIDNNLHMILGLEKDAIYSFSFYKGTRYISFATVADAQVFQLESIIELKNAYEKTENGYFIINLPDNLTNGYYYISGLGMFEYAAR